MWFLFAGILLFACSSGERHLPFRAMVYSSNFATRFRLSDQGVYQLGDGLQAIALRVTQHSRTAPLCLLDLYVDDSLDVPYPAGTEGRRNYDDEEDPQFFVKDDRVDDPDSIEHRWPIDRTLSYHAAACGRSHADCLLFETSADAFYRELWPGLNLLTYDIPCPWLDPKYGPTEIWMLKSHRDAKGLNVHTGDPRDVYRFSMPFALLKHAEEPTHEGAEGQSRSWPDPVPTSFSIPKR